MKDQELVKALREHAEWQRGNEWETPITLGDDLVEAADRIANQSTHILALQKEIAGLRKAVRWVHDGLYLCDPEKNTVCKKAAVKRCVFTPRSRSSRTPWQRRQHRSSGESRWRNGCRRIVAMSSLSRIGTKDGASIWAGALPKGLNGVSMSALGIETMSPSRTGCRCHNRWRCKL